MLDTREIVHVMSQSQNHLQNHWIEEHDKKRRDDSGYAHLPDARDQGDRIIGLLVNNFLAVNVQYIFAVAWM